MNKVFGSFLVISFVLWVLPLGVFIKSSQEKLACDGQRAICMCHAMVLKSPGAGLKIGPSTNKENSSGGGANYFVSARPVIALNLKSASFFENQYLCYKSPFLAALEYVPKF
jgi:hypothetical protein